MQLRLPDEQQLLSQTFADLFSAESSPERIRAAEPVGFDAGLWKTLLETGALGMRVPESLGGGGASIFDAVLLCEQAGRHLASAPVAECIAIAGLLARLGGEEAERSLAAIFDGSRVIVLAPRVDAGSDPQLVPGGAAADAVVALQGDEVWLVEGSAQEAPANLGAAPLGVWRLQGEASPGSPRVLAKGGQARQAFLAALEEWKLLTASAVNGLARRAIEIAAAYSNERIQWDRPIGAFQAIAHPLADSVTAVDGGRLLIWDTAAAIAQDESRASAQIPMCWAWAAESASSAVARALHTHGGYGVSLEYDIQLYHRRAKAWALVCGDPRDQLLDAATRLWDDTAALPCPDEPGEVPIDFGLGERAEVFRLEVRRFFEENLSEELRARARYDWEGHDPDFHRSLAAAGLAFPSWPEEYGGLGRDPYDATAMGEEFHRVGWSTHGMATTRVIGESLLRFGSDEFKRDVIPRICSGEVVLSMGYSEPSSGSDVAAAQTRAVRDGDEWVINGQKMFTSGANRAQYVFLLTRTDPEARKHRGLTMFLVPLDAPGVEIQPIHTLSDERTNATYYTDVRVPDSARVGEVNGGWEVLAYALEIEHGGGAGGFSIEHGQLVENAVTWARGARRNGGLAIDDPRVRERLARAATRARVAHLINMRSLFTTTEGEPDRGEGPMTKLFTSEAYLEDSTDLLDLAAPDSLMKSVDGPHPFGASFIEFSYRLSTATTVYAGTSEIMRSIIAQMALGMPRSRS